MLKAFVTKKTDELRLPYDRASSQRTSGVQRSMRASTQREFLIGHQLATEGSG
jgi:predicted P-loop ATPase